MTEQPRPDLTPLRERYAELNTDLWQWISSTKASDIASIEDKIDKSLIMEAAILADRRRMSIQRELNALNDVFEYFNHEPPPPPPPLPPTKAPLAPSAAFFFFAIWICILASVYLGLLIMQR
jgi:hypothetical protein